MPYTHQVAAYYAEKNKTSPLAKPAATSKPRLTYFDLPGRAEPTRLAFAIAGVEFEDRRLSFEEFGALKAQPNTKFQHLPVLEVLPYVYNIVRMYAYL